MSLVVIWATLIGFTGLVIAILDANRGRVYHAPGVVDDQCCSIYPVAAQRRHGAPGGESGALAGSAVVPCDGCRAVPGSHAPDGCSDRRRDISLCGLVHRAVGVSARHVPAGGLSTAGAGAGYPYLPDNG